VSLESKLLHWPVIFCVAATNPEFQRLRFSWLRWRCQGVRGGAATQRPGAVSGASDDAALTTKAAWAALLRRSRHIGDFRAWKDHDAYQRTLERLLRDLRVEAT